MDHRVQKNQFGYYELAKKPTPEALRRYYAEKYFQEAKGSYETEYDQEEIDYFYHKLDQKYRILRSLLPSGESKGKKFLDVGAGEGWALSYFKQQGWVCTGLDYSEYGTRAHNPERLANLICGDIYQILDQLLTSETKYDAILLDNILEHVLDPQFLLERLKSITNTAGVLIIEVPNDFSILQQCLLERGDISQPFWVVSPDHISYFSRKGLIALCNEVGWDMKIIMGDYPIDFNLFNPDTNYIKDPTRGKSCHRARVKIENLLHEISPDKTNKLYQALGELGLGREIIGFFQ